MTVTLTRAQFLDELKERVAGTGQARHPFMVLLHDGNLTKKQLKAWIVNRFYFQRSVPLKDAVILSQCPVPEVRKIWLSRILRREGMQRDVGDIEGWVALAEAAGVSREELSKARFLPGVKFAVDAYVNFARSASWVDGVAASLFEYFARDELVRRISAFRKHYKWVDSAGLGFFISRLAQIEESNESALDIVLKYTPTRRDQLSAISAASFTSQVTWSLNDAIYMGYVVNDWPLSDSL